MNFTYGGGCWFFNRTLWKQNGLPQFLFQQNHLFQCCIQFCPQGIHSLALFLHQIEIAVHFFLCYFFVEGIKFRLHRLGPMLQLPHSCQLLSSYSTFLLRTIRLLLVLFFLFRFNCLSRRICSSCFFFRCIQPALESADIRLYTRWFDF